MTLRPSPNPPGVPTQGREQSIVAGLRRQVEHVRQHSRHQDWEAMLSAIERLDAVAAAWQRSGTGGARVVADFAERELPLLKTHFDQIEAELQAESRRIQQTRRQLQASREFRPSTTRELPRRLDASA